MKFDVLLIDGANLAHRAAHAGKSLTTEINGAEVQIGAVYQFLRTLVSAWETHSAPDGCPIIVAWEGGPDLERARLFPDYKKDRNHQGEVYDQIDLLQKEVLPLTGVMQAMCTGWEADDVLASVAISMFEMSGDTSRIGILSGDHDMHQIVTDKIHVINPSNRPDLDDGITWRPRDVRRRWLVEPHLIPDVKALSGDSSDGIPGVRGIGEKWGKDLVAKYGSLEAVLEAVNAPSDIPKGKQTAIRRDADNARLFKRICTINRDVDVQFLPRRTDFGELWKKFRELRFASLLIPSVMSKFEEISHWRGNG